MQSTKKKASSGGIAPQNYGLPPSSYYTPTGGYGAGGSANTQAPQTYGGGSTGGGGGGGGGGGFTLPDFSALIANDPAYQQELADLKSQGIADTASRHSARNRALIQFGEVPDFAKAGADLGLIGPDFATDIDAGTGQLASDNPFSTEKRLGQAHTDAIRTITNALAGRGLLQSGETGFQLGRENTNYGTGQYDSMQKLLDYLGGVQDSYTQGVRQRQAAAQAALAAAYQNQLAMWLAQLQFGGGGGGGGGSGGGGGGGGGGAPPPAADPYVNWLNTYHGGVSKATHFGGW